MVDVTYDKVVATYVKIRDTRNAARAKHKAEDAALVAKLEALENFMLGQMNNAEVVSFRTASGTAYRTETMVPTGADWTAFYAWVHETKGYDFFFRRIKADAVKDYMDQHDGAAPPGVSVFTRFGVTIRRS
jgi:hypothetical protein